MTLNRVAAEVIAITVFPPYTGFMLILRELHGIRWLPIFIGQSEANSINTLVKGQRPVRPLTFDLIGSLLFISGSKIDSITVNDLRQDTFFAEVHVISPNGDSQRIDARPSDAIALALKTQAPIFIAEHVLQLAGKTEELNFTSGNAPDKLQELNQLLQQAVDNEAYEDAAKLRDKIRELEEQNA